MNFGKLRHNKVQSKIKVKCSNDRKNLKLQKQLTQNNIIIEDGDHDYELVVNSKELRIYNKTGYLKKSAKNKTSFDK